MGAGGKAATKREEPSRAARLLKHCGGVAGSLPNPPELGQGGRMPFYSCSGGFRGG
jgi:hypothetical protein